MPALIIIGIIVLLIVFLLRCNIRAEISYSKDVFDFKVKYLFFTVFPQKEKKEKKPKRSKKDKKSKNISEENIAKNIDEKKDNGDEVTVSEVKDKLDDAAEYVSEPAEKAVKDEKKGEKKKSEDKIQLLKDRIELVKIIWKSVKVPLVRLFHGIHIDDLMIDIVVGGEDACEAAVNYGKMNAIVYNAISFVRIWFQISVKTVDVGCDFDAKKSVYNAEAKVKLRLGTALAVVITAAVGYLKNKNELGKADVGAVNSDIEKA